MDRIQTKKLSFRNLLISLFLIDKRFVKRRKRKKEKNDGRTRNV